MNKDYTLKLWRNPISSYWYVRIYVKDGVIQARRALGTKDEVIARKNLRDIKKNGAAASWAKELSAKQKKKPAPETKSKLRIDELVRWYVETHLPSLKRADKTIMQYHRVLRDLVSYCRARNVGRIDQLSSRIVQDWQAWLAESRIDGKQRPVRRDELLIVRGFVHEACGMHNIDEPRIRWNIPRKGTESKFRALSQAELTAYLEMIQAKTRGIYDVVLWLALTGWRSGDVLDLRWSEIGDRMIRRQQIKSKRMLEFPVTPAMREVLDRQAKTGPRVFPLEYSVLKKKMEYAASKHFHRPVSPRDLRKTYGTLQAGRRCPPEILRQLMGHASVEMTLQYYVETTFESISAEAVAFDSAIIRRKSNSS